MTETKVGPGPEKPKTAPCRPAEKTPNSQTAWVGRQDQAVGLIVKETPETLETLETLEGPEAS